MPRAAAWWLLALGAASIGFGRLFGLVELYVVGTSLVAAVIVATAMVRRPVGLIMHRSIAPDMPSVDTPAFVEVDIEAIRKSPAGRIRDPRGTNTAAEIDVNALPLGSRARTRYSLPVERRGVVTVGPATLEVVDPLGLARRRAAVAGRQSVMVLPRWTRIELPRIGSTEGELISVLTTSLARHGQSDEFRGMREYSAGDDPRRINWKATARRDVQLVNEYDAATDLQTIVVLDTLAAHYDDRSFETAVSVATSFILSSIDESTGRDHRVRLVIDGSEVIDIDGANRDALALRMATIATLADDSPPSPSPLAAPGMLNVGIVISGSVDHEWLSDIRRGVGRLDGAVLVNVGPHDVRPPGLRTINPRDFAEFAGQWDHLVRRRKSNWT
jgi:uncharacterized protein (DUF58 family)